MDSDDPRSRFDRLLKAMLSGPPPGTSKRGEQPQKQPDSKRAEKPE